MKRYGMAASLFAVFLIFILFPSSATTQPLRRPGRMANDFPLFLKNVLNLTPEQEARLQEFRKARQEEMKAFQEKMKKMRSELRELMKDPKADEKKIDGLIDEMSKLRAMQFKSSVKQRKEIRKIFTPEQLEKMDKFKARLMDQRAMRKGQPFPQGRFLRQGRFFGPERFGGPWGRGYGFRGPSFRERMRRWW